MSQAAAAAAAADMDHHKQEIRGSVTLTQHILLSQRDYPVSRKKNGAVCC
jgi:hypothetical protein